jgi:DNA-directed RNA polymerase specialized sigma24 family protein
LLKTNTGNRNRRRIALALYLISMNVGKRFHYADDRAEDAAAEALLLAIEQIELFDRRRRHAAGYFATMMRNKMRELLAGNDYLVKRHRRRRLKLDSLDMGGDRQPVKSFVTAKKWKLRYNVVHPALRAGYAQR